MRYDRDSFLSGVAVGRNMKSWPKMDGTLQDSFMFVIDTELGGSTEYDFWLKKDNSNYPYIIIDWGDGTESLANDGANTHQYQEHGKYVVSVHGYIHSVKFGLSQTYYSESSALSLLAILTPIRVSPNIYSNTIALTSLCSGCRNLSHVPGGLFKYYYQNGYYIGLQYAFTNCKALKKVSESLFDGYLIQDSIYRIDLPQMFNGSGLEEIPANLFSSVDFSKVQWMEMMFAGTNITTIPSGLFDHLVNCRGFNSVFQNCQNLRSVPSDLFSEIVDIGSCRFTFYNCSSIVSSVPNLWDDFPDADHVYCYRGCTGALNYDAIPAGWK